MNPKEKIQSRVDEMNKNLKTLEDLILKTEDVSVKEHYKQARLFLLNHISTLEWVLKQFS